MHVHALGHREAQRPRHQRLGLLDREVVLVVAALVGDIEDVAKALGGQQRRARAAPLDHGVGGKRRAVHEHSDVAEAAPGIGQDQPHTVENRLLGPLRRGQQLARQPLPALFQHHVRERAADVDGNAQIPDHLESRPISCKRGATVDRRSPALQFAGQDAYGRSVTATAPTLRARLYALLRYSDPTPGARQVRVAHLIVLGIGLFAVILLSVDELDGRRPAGPAHHHLDRHLHLPRRIPDAPVGGAGDATLRPGHADQGAAALGGVDPGADRPAGRLAGLHVRRRLRHHRSRRRLGLLRPLDPQGRPARAGLQYAGPRRVQRARADRQRADPVRHPADDCRHRRAHAGTRAPARAVRLAARRHVVGRGHAHHDGLRRRRAAHAWAAA